MHGDDVASAGVEVSTQIVSKTTELIMEMIKVAIEKERNAKGYKPKSAVLSGGEVTYQKLKEGGEVTMLPSFAKFQFKLTDNEQGKSLTMNFCTKAKLERVLQERMGYSEVKAVEVANSLTNKLTYSQRQYYLSDSRQLGEMDFYETDIKFDDDNLLLENYSFVKLKENGDDEPKLTVTDKSGNFVVLSAKNLDRAEVEERLRAYLKINDSETIKAILDKSERLGFAEQPKQVQFKEFQIERDMQSSFTVRGGPTTVRLNLSNKDTAKKQLMEAFGISAGKAEKIIGKAQKQKVADNLLKKAREKVKDAADTIRHKKIERGSRK